MLSVFHQLHCLSYLAQHYRPSTSPHPFDNETEILHHSVHCFDYLRQSLMCAADTSLEGKTTAGPGWGATHVCADYEKVVEWANQRTVVKWRNLMPGTAVL
jgi:hypothetical protein